MRLWAALTLVLVACLSPPHVVSADPAPADTATARILAEADSIRARQASEAAILARADSIRNVPHPDSLALRQLKYESQKKSVAVGIGLGLLLPGLGDFYSGDTIGGVGLLAMGIVGAALASGDETDTFSVGDALLVTAVIASPIAGGISASEHNEKVKKKLGLEVTSAPSGRPALALATHF